MTDDRDLDHLKPAYVLLPRQALFEFFGAMALPPWFEPDGTVVGSAIDCAPIAERIITWVEGHDLMGGVGPFQFEDPLWAEAHRRSLLRSGVEDPPAIWHHE